MERITRQDLDTMIAGIQPAHYNRDNGPILAVVFQEAVTAIGKYDGVSDLRVLKDIKQRFPSSHDAPYRDAHAAFIYNGRLVSLQFGEHDHGSSPCYDFCVDSADPKIARHFGQQVIELIKSRDADSLWQDAVNRGFAKQSSAQFEAEQTANELRRNFRFVRVYAGSHNAVWTFDNGVFLWGKGDREYDTEPATMCLEVGSEPTTERTPIIAAVASKPLLDRDMVKAGLRCSSSGSRVARSYFADKTRETALLAAFDKLRDAFGLQVQYDNRRAA